MIFRELVGIKVILSPTSPFLLFGILVNHGIKTVTELLTLASCK